MSEGPAERAAAAEGASALADAAGWHVTADDSSGDLVVGAGTPLDGIAVAAVGDDAETRVVPLVAATPNGAGAADAASRKATRRGRRRRRAVTAAACTVVLV